MDNKDFIKSEKKHDDKYLYIKHICRKFKKTRS